jgi:hypothetical protein
MLAHHASSPSLRHLRDYRMLNDVSRQIVRRLLHRSTVWKKWEGEREPFIRSVSCCWIPVEELRAFLNELPGPSLTLTDVVERLRAIHEEPYERFPNEDVRDGCLALYEREKQAGTELQRSPGPFAPLSRRKKNAWKVSAGQPGMRRGVPRRRRWSSALFRALIANGPRSMAPRTSIAGSTVAAIACLRRWTNDGNCTALDRWRIRASWSAVMRHAAMLPKPWPLLPISRTSRCRRSTNTRSLATACGLQSRPGCSTIALC